MYQAGINNITAYERKYHSIITPIPEYCLVTGLHSGMLFESNRDHLPNTIIYANSSPFPPGLFLVVSLCTRARAKTAFLRAGSACP